MHSGYSLLLGDRIDADLIDYRDCEKFQIVCPNCFEPLRKTVRRCEGARFSHYLSHYTRDELRDEECELRVAGGGHGSVASLNQVARGQRLIYFLSVLHEAVEEDMSAFPPDDDAADSYQREIIDGLEGSTVMDAVADIAATSAARDGYAHSEDEFEGLMGRHQAGLPEGLRNNTLRTDYEHDNQVRTARDIWQHLLTPRCHDNFRYLFRRAYAAVCVRMDATEGARTLAEDEEMLWGGMMEIVGKKDDEIQGFLETMAGLSAEDLFSCTAPNMYCAMIDLVLGEMIGTLGRLPYQELLTRPAARELRDVLRAAAASQPYFTDECYAVGDRLSHPTFGSGRVVKVRDKKITVKFGDGLRTLVHATDVVD